MISTVEARLTDTIVSERLLIPFSGTLPPGLIGCITAGSTVGGCIVPELSKRHT